MSDLSLGVETLIQLLADGEWHSGDQLGGALGVSRAAISKKMKQLQSLNMQYESAKGKGYKLREPLDLLHEDALTEKLLNASAHQACSANLIIKSVLDSTNSYLLREMRERDVHRSVCMAELQTSGKGRRGREWYSPYGQNLYLSLAYSFTSGVAAIEGLSLAVGVVISEALESLGVSGVRLKWPNDILVEDKKLGGILIELGGDAVSNCVAIIGVGLNLSLIHI